MTVASEYKYTFEKHEIDGINMGDTLVLSFDVCACECTPLEVGVLYSDKKEIRMEYFVPVQKTKIGMLLNEGTPQSVVFNCEGKIDLENIRLENRKNQNLETACLDTGMFILEDYKKITLAEEEIGVGGCTDIVKHQNTVYTIGKGKLTAVDISDVDAPKILGCLEINSPLRQIAMCKDGKNLVITCRQDGMLVVDVTCPKNMKIRTHYDTIEFATGLVISGNYAFVSCRQFGVEIVDVSDLDNPRHVSIVRCGEAQSCKIHDGILYAGVWGGCRVDIVDVKNPAKPVILAKAPLNGKGDGLTVHTFDGKTYLYAATGQHSENVDVNSPLTEPRYGQGNGLDIYDVTDPKNPVWLSTSKIDGRFYNTSNDYWETEISKTPDGKIYAYLVNTYNGVYIFDVTEPKKVKRLCNINIKIPKESSRYTLCKHPERAIVFPFNQHEYTQDAVGACLCLDGCMLVAGVATDLHTFKDNKLVYQSLESEEVHFEENGSFYAETPREFSALYKNGGQIYGVCAHNKNVFAACGQKGIACLNGDDLKELYRVPTKGVCFDCAVYGDSLYSAEGDMGLGVYKICEKGLIEIDRFIPYGNAVRSLRLSPGGKYALVQCGSSMCLVVRLSDKAITHTLKTRGIMYFKNLCNNPVDNRYMGVYGYGSQTYWLDFGKDGSYDTPVLIENGGEGVTFRSSVISMAGGCEAFGKKSLGICYGGKYILYSPQDPEMPFDKMSLLPKRSANMYFDGKPSVKGNTVVVTDRIEGIIYIGKISDDGDIFFDKKISTAGNPDVALITDNGIYVPLGYQELAKINK